MTDEILKQNGEPFNPKWLFTYSTANVILSILFGKSFIQSSPHCHANILKGSAECMENIDMALNMAPIVRFLPTFWKTTEGLKSGIKLLLSAIDEGIEFIKSNNFEPTFVGRFLEIEGPNYDHKDLHYIVRDLSFADERLQRALYAEA